MATNVISPINLVWIASSRRDIRDLPKSVQRSFGISLFAAQCGESPPDSKPLRGFGGAGVLELIEDDRSGTYRAVYTVKFEEAVYVLHVFQKKSKSGICTPAQDINLVKERLKRAEELHIAWKKEQIK